MIFPGSTGESNRAPNMMNVPRPTRPACPVRLRSFGPRALLVGKVSASTGLTGRWLGVTAADCGAGVGADDRALVAKPVFTGRVVVCATEGCAGVGPKARTGLAACAGVGAPPVTAMRVAA